MMKRLRATPEAGVTLVELLIVLVLSGVLGTIITTTVIGGYRTEQFTSEMQQVMDDGRLSLDRIRKELRGGRRVYDSSTAQHLFWWTDQNQDGLQQPEERIHYCVAPLTSTTCVTSTATGGKYRLIRWTDAESPSAARTIAATLVTTDVFSGFATPITGTRVVDLVFDLDVQSGGRGPESIQMSASVRLRNVA
jgi:prepilin-type N-terminal cleavage/methylation domain-containing protein